MRQKVELMSLIQTSLVDQNKVFKETKKLDGNKANQKNDIPVKTMKENINIMSYILYHNSLFDCVFQRKLKEAEITPVYKKEVLHLNFLPSCSKCYP